MQKFGKDKRVVIIDDNITFLEEFKLLLKQQGFEGGFCGYTSSLQFIMGAGRDADLVISKLFLSAHGGLFISEWLKDCGYKKKFAIMTEEIQGDLDLEEIETFQRPVLLDDLVEMVRVWLG